MRSRRGRGSSLVAEQQARMALREQPGPNGERHQADEDEEDQVSSARDKRRRQRQNKAKCKALSEDEMMDLALRLSEQEASGAASRRKREDDAVMKAVQESMVDRMQTFPSSQSQSLLAEQHDVPRWKLVSSNGKTASAGEQGDETGEVKATGGENKKRKREEGGCSPDSLQSCDSSQVDDRPLRKSPVFPSTGCRAAVCVTRLSQELLETCRTSGFVSCSQDTWIQKSPVGRAKSPTFPKSPMSVPACPGSPLFTDTDWGDDGDRSPEPGASPVFGRTAQHHRSPSACKPRVCKNSGLTFSSQESLSSSVRSASSRPRSPVFPGTPAVFSGTEPGRGCSSSPAGSDVMSPSLSRGCHGDVESPSITRPSLEEDCRTDPRLSQMVLVSGGAEELTSDMTLLWSDDDDVTPAASPSPVFPEENHVTAAEPDHRGTNREPAAGPTVHYYWGVPFCPRGLDPDQYTQVILAQMEVYEKSLKEAQRRLLRKAAWGEPVLPRPEAPENYPSSESPAESPQPHFAQRRRRRKRQESADASPAKEEKEPENKEDERNDGGDEDTDDCEICPETPPSDANNEAGDASAAPGAQAEPDGFGQTGSSDAGDVEPRLDPDVTAPESQDVDCPICQGSFPAEEIELHAAYCDGEVAIVDERRVGTVCLTNALTPRRKRTRRATDEDEVGSSAAGRNREKCYVCQKAVPLRDYGRHTELCIQQQAAKPSGNLLSALEQSEGRNSEAGPSDVQPGEAIDLRDDEDDDVSVFRVTRSPFASAADAFDFRKQERSPKPSRRRR